MTLDLEKKRRAVDAVAAVDKELADQLYETLHEDDPVAVAIESLTGEVRAMRWQLIVVVLVAMALNAGMVGVGLQFSAAGYQISTSTPTAAAEPIVDAVPPAEPEPQPVPLTTARAW